MLSAIVGQGQKVFLLTEYPLSRKRLNNEVQSEVLSFPRKIVLNGGTQAPYPFGIAVFENHVFFTDWTKMGVVRANRFNGSNPALLYRTAKRPGHVVVSHAALQPVGKEVHLLFCFIYLRK